MGQKLFWSQDPIAIILCKAQHSTSESLGPHVKPTGLRGVKIPEIYCQLGV